MRMTVIPEAVITVMAVTMIKSAALLLVCLLIALIRPLYAGDQLREQEYADALKKAGINSVRLSANKHDFLAVYQADLRGSQQAVIVLHDMGAQPDQQAVVSAIRRQMPQHQWHSLSIQLPLREASASEQDYYALFDEARSRVEAAVDYLHQKKIKRIALIGYGLGAAMAVYAAQAKPTEFAALAAISLPVPESALPQLQIVPFLKNLTMPVLDVYAENDLPNVVMTAQDRQLAGAENPVYRQVVLEDMDHSYQGDIDLLVKRIYGWLNNAD
jgi:poly(3-hydroxybutyrate) depolymerase